MERKNFKISPLDEVPLLRRKHYCLNKATSFPSTHIILCQEVQSLFVYLRSPSPGALTASSFSLLLSSSASTGFALICLAFVHLTCFTPPHLLNLLLIQVLTTVSALYIKYSALFHSGITEFSARWILTHFVSLQRLPSS